MGKKLTVEDILSSTDIKEETIFIKEWKGDVTIRGLDVEQMQSVRRAALVDGEIDEDKFGLLLFIAGVSEPKFEEKHIDDLKKKSLMAYGKVITRLQEICGIADDEAKQVKKS